MFDTRARSVIFVNEQYHQLRTSRNSLNRSTRSVCNSSYLLEARNYGETPSNSKLLSPGHLCKEYEGISRECTTLVLSSYTVFHNRADFLFLLYFVKNYHHHHHHDVCRPSVILLSFVCALLSHNLAQSATNPRFHASHRWQPRQTVPPERLNKFRGRSKFTKLYISMCTYK